MKKTVRVVFALMFCFSMAVSMSCFEGFDDADIATAKTALDSLSSLNPIEGIDTNAIKMAQAIVDEVVSGVTVSINDASGNANVASDGTITYGVSYVSGNVVFALNKGTGTEDTSTVLVNVPKLKALYDDFSLDIPYKWIELTDATATTSTISVNGGTCNLSLETAAGNDGYTNIKFPTNLTTNTYKYIEMKGTLNSVSTATDAYVQLRILGTFYSNAENSNVFAVIRLIDGPYGMNASMALFTVDTSNLVTLYDTIYIFSKISLGTGYTMSISYDGDRTFTGTFNGSTHSIEGPARYGDPLTATIPGGKQINLFIQGGSSEGSSISASVDDVYVR